MQKRTRSLTISYLPQQIILVFFSHVESCRLPRLTHLLDTKCYAKKFKPQAYYHATRLEKQLRATEELQLTFALEG